MRTSSSIVWGASEVASVGVPSGALAASGASGAAGTRVPSGVAGAGVVPLPASSRALSFVSLSSKVLRLSR